MNDKKPSSQHQVRFSRIRGIVALLCVIAVILGLALNIDFGTPSALGAFNISAICPLGALETIFGAKGASIHLLIILAAVIVAIIVVGKAFCAWVCPVPWVERFFQRFKKEKTSASETKDATSLESQNTTAQKCSSCNSCSGKTCAIESVGGKRDGNRVDMRHGVLVGALASAAIFGFPVFCLICPIGITFALIIGLWDAIILNSPSIALLVFAAVLIVEIVFFRKWCTHLCPISALMSLISCKSNILRPRVNKNTCLREQGTDCHHCVDVCPELLDPHSKHIPECRKCGLCIQECPTGAIKLSFFNAGKEKPKLEAKIGE